MNNCCGKCIYSGFGHNESVYSKITCKNSNCPCHKPTDKETSGVFICRTKDTTGGEETHSACLKRIKEEGGKARCCYCVSHKDCEINSTPKAPYNQRDHSHCWESKEPPCGLKGTHGCCLCELPAPEVSGWESEKVEQYKFVMEKLFNLSSQPKGQRDRKSRVGNQNDSSS